MDDTVQVYSTVDVASRLGVSIPTIHRAITKLDLEPFRGPKGHLRLSEEDAHKLLRYLGKAPKVEGLTREELFVLSSLYVRPFGLRSRRLVAVQAGISPSTASKSLNNLMHRGMVEHRHATEAVGSAREIDVWILRLIPYWLTDSYAAALRCTIPPVRIQAVGQDSRVPGRFRHLFWNADRKRLNTRDHGTAIAISILEQNNPHALAWAMRNIDPEAFALASRPRRGSTPDRLALAGHISAVGVERQSRSTIGDSNDASPT
ncbi:MAG: MerR family transcriptional regulator [Acidimicrobiales bacterium]